jgi:hypothetical protein
MIGTGLFAAIYRRLVSNWRSPPAADFGSSAVAVCAALVILSFLSDAPPSLLWDSESYFIAARRFSDQFPYIPTLDFRAFGYPAFLKLFQSGDNFDLTSIIAAQKALFIINTVLVYWMALRVSGSRVLGLLAALLFTLNFRIMLLANSIMVETLAVFLELLFVLCLVEFVFDRSKRAWLLGGAAVLAAAIFVRPTFVAALPPLVVLPLLRPGIPIWRRCVLAFATSAIVVIPVIAFSAYNYHRTGFFKAFHGAGFSSLNYVTNPCLFQKLSDKVAYVREPLVTFQRRHFPQFDNIADRDARCTSWFWPYDRPREINWTNTFGEILKPSSEQRYGQIRLDWDTMAMRITLDAASDQPREYFRIWTQVFTEFWAAYFHLEGYYATVEDFDQRRSILHGRPAESLFKQIERLNSYFTPWFSLPVLLAALGLAIVGVGPLPPESRWAMLFVTGYCLLYSLLSTLLEATWQSRYRVPLDPLVCACMAFAARAIIQLAIPSSGRPPINHGAAGRQHRK